jgi:hypothetical protein
MNGDSLPRTSPKSFNRNNWTISIFWGVGIVFFFVAWLKLLGQPADYQSYVETILHPSTRTGTEEFSYQLFLYLNNLLLSHSVYLFFFLYAILGVSIKFYAIFKKSKLPLYSLLLYLPSYFLLHEYVQIRASIAIGIFIFAIDDIVNGNKRNYLLKTGLAMLFHWSAAIMLPLYFIARILNWKQAIVLPLLALTLNFIRFIPSISIPDTSIVSTLYTYYIIHSGQTESVNILNVMTVLQLFIFYILAFNVWRFERHQELDGQTSIMLKIVSISLFVFFVFSALHLPVIAFRLNEFLNIVLFFLIPIIITKSKNKSVFALLGIFYFLLYSANLILKTGVIPALKQSLLS